MGGSIVGRVLLHQDFPSQTLGNQRNIVVYLPPGYDAEPARRFPVLYLQDGQNVFDSRTSAFGVDWNLDGTAEKLIRRKVIEPIIMVGIYNSPDRMREYTPAWSDRVGTGRAEQYGDFIVDELKPFIDAVYRTRPEREYTGLLGSSLGGLCSLYLSFHHHGTFGRVGAVSPSLWFGQGTIFHWIPQREPLRGPDRIWACAGSGEGRPPGSDFSWAIEAVRRLRHVLIERGYHEGHSYFHFEHPGGRHNEQSWGARSDKILKALYGPR